MFAVLFICFTIYHEEDIQQRQKLAIIHIEYRKNNDRCVVIGHMRSLVKSYLIVSEQVYERSFLPVQLRSSGSRHSIQLLHHYPQALGGPSTPIYCHSILSPRFYNRCEWRTDVLCLHSIWNETKFTKNQLHGVRRYLHTNKPEQSSIGTPKINGSFILKN